MCPDRLNTNQEVKSMRERGFFILKFWFKGNSESNDGDYAVEDYDDAGGLFDSASGGSLEESVPGVPGEDYPIFSEVPDTSFSCDGQVEGGYYADPEAECQAFHICGSDGNGGLTKYSFLCPNGTLFNQQYFVCDWWFNVDCSLAEQFYTLNDQIAAERDANSPAGAGGDGGYQAGGETGGRGGQGGQGSQGGRAGGRRGSQGSASSPRGSYSAPAGGDFGGDFAGDSGFGSADSGYGAPAGGSLSGYTGRRRNARDLDVSDADQILAEEYDYWPTRGDHENAKTGWPLIYKKLENEPQSNICNLLYKLFTVD